MLYNIIENQTHLIFNILLEKNWKMNWIKKKFNLVFSF